MEQVIQSGTCISYHPNDSSFAIISNGFFQVHAYIPVGVTVVPGRAYQVYKQGTTYYVGSEVMAQ